MFESMRVRVLCVGVLVVFAVEARVEGGALPGVIGSNRSHQRVLIGPLETGDSVGIGGWRMRNLLAEAAEGVQSKIGRSALAFGGDAEVAGAKGDFKVHGALAGKTKALGVWVYLERNANIDKVGIQAYDAQGEALMMLVSADWSGWRWVEFEMVGEHVRQSYRQAEKNGLVDQPLHSQHIVWFAEAAGATRMIVDGMVALVDRGEIVGGEELTVTTVAPDGVEAGQTPVVSVLSVNYTDEPIAVDLSYSFQIDPSLYSSPLPDPVFGSNHTSGLRSWTVADGEVIEEGSLSDGQSWTSAGTDYKTNHFAEAFQYVELDRVRRITKMTWLSGDANHTWFVDVAVSLDGKEFTPVSGLQDIDHHKKWGWLDYPIKSPFAAKVIRFRHHTGDSQKKVHAIRFPSELGLYDGAGDETVALPQVGRVLNEGNVKVTVPARSFELADLPNKVRLDAGACLLGVEAAWSGKRNMSYSHIFTALRADASLVSADSRLGLNTAHQPLAPKLRDLGIGWVRFENMKWPFVSPEPHKYVFDGSRGPWHVNTDAIFQGYRENGLNILSYMFLTPKWISSAPEGTKDDRVITYPPKDLSLFGEFCFQVAARYGNTHQPDRVLLSGDKKSGLGLVHYYEMWNEPGLNPKPDATWGGWSAPLDEYYKMMRYGAEAVKKADPTAIVTSAGYAGITKDVVNRLRTYKYPDGKCPLDFVEVINVHYYSGQKPPETTREDGNARVTSSTTFVQDLEELAAWRDKYAPEMPIWMTETGYDSAGPFGTTEAIQAARLPRAVMLCLAFGIDKVFVYRESGSTPSMHACSGLLRNDFSEKPSWFTYGTLVRQFKDVKGKAVRLPHADENLWLLKWDEGSKALLTAWVVDGKAQLGIELGACAVTDAFGAESKVRGTGELEVMPYPIYIRNMESSTGWRKLLADYDRQQLELKRRRERARVCRKYLYDFGGADRVGEHLLEGIRFGFTPVKAADVWDEARGYGFNKPAMSDDNRSWVSSKLDGDGCRLNESMQFRFRIEPGRYGMALGFGPFADSSTVTIRGLQEPLEMVLTKKVGVAEAEIVVAETTVLSTSHKGYGEIRWLSLVEKTD